VHAAPRPAYGLIFLHQYGNEDDVTSDTDAVNAPDVYFANQVRAPLAPLPVPVPRCTSLCPNVSVLTAAYMGWRAHR
jgi:hypothetical protein